METIERKIEFTVKQYLAYTILLRMSEGWTVLYTIHTQTPPTNFFTPTNPTQQYYVNEQKGIPNYSQLGLITLQVEEYIEVCFIKRNFEKDPCPRCSYPYPDLERIDREV
jgi:hypothetical protein